MGDIVPILGDVGKLQSIQIWVLDLILIDRGRRTSVLGNSSQFGITGNEYMHSWYYSVGQCYIPHILFFWKASYNTASVPWKMRR